jgi:hypothetical protein
MENERVDGDEVVEMWLIRQLLNTGSLDTQY